MADDTERLLPLRLQTVLLSIVYRIIFSSAVGGWRCLFFCMFMDDVGVNSAGRETRPLPFMGTFRCVGNVPMCRGAHCAPGCFAQGFRCGTGGHRGPPLRRSTAAGACAGAIHQSPNQRSTIRRRISSSRASAAWALVIMGSSRAPSGPMRVYMPPLEMLSTWLWPLPIRSRA